MSEIFEDDKFINKCVDGTESPENISRYIKQWADTDMSIDLIEYLGFKNNVHYRLYMEDKSFLYNYINKLRIWEDMNNFERKEKVNELVTDVAIYSTMNLKNNSGNITFTPEGFDEDEEDDNEEGFVND